MGVWPPQSASRQLKVNCPEGAREATLGCPHPLRDRGALGRGIISADRARVRVGESILAEMGAWPGVGAGVGAV